MSVNTSPEPRVSPFRPFRHPIFRWVWITSTISNFGGLIEGVGAAWMMVTLAAPASMEGVDLRQVAAGAPLTEGRPQWATLGAHETVRWGSLVLHTLPGKQPTLCDISDDPQCTRDRSDTSPLVARELHRWLVAAEQAASMKRRAPHEIANIDLDTAAAMRVWGE